MSKGCENHCSMLKQANETIKRMAEWIDRNSGETICKEMIDNKRDRLRAECQVIGCVDCIIQYFEWIGKLK